ncbi:MATE family efflux transporter [Dawidia soli]|uniref:Multidrug-efflux transporter n=1 Tax=Dawidia soli TaxID=2782352 RepID=A0AAP2DCB8_9BACT|nr:MATE family efflux transporter [Dawidia soli]MBT1689491.1 MATE family efflux transporter [Dawidia soli]
MTLRTHFRENLILALPVMLSNLGHVLMGVTDTMMVGHLGAESLAAAGLALVVFNVFMLFGVGVSYAMTPLVAAAHGAGDTSTIAAVVRHGLVVNVLNALALVGVVTVGKNVLYYMGQSDAVVAQALPFLDIVAWSLVPMMVFQTCKQFAEGMSNTRVALIVMVAANLLNVLLNYIFIYGHFGMPALGLTGAAWATFTSRVFMALAMAALVYALPSFRSYRAGFGVGDYARPLFRRLLGLGIPSGVQFIFEAAAFDFSLVMMGWYGARVQAAHQIAINLASLSYMTTAGLGAAATVRVGYYLGRQDGINMRRASYTLIVMAMAFMSVCAVVFVVFRQVLPTWYVHDADVVPLAATLLIIAGMFQLSDGMQVVCASALRGLQDVKIPSLFIFLSYWAIGLPLGYWLGFHAGVGPVGIWWGLVVGLTLTATALFIRLRWALRRIP